MSIWTSTYFIYGARVNVDPYSDDLEKPDMYPVGIGYLTAGAYDRHMSFLTATSWDVLLGEYEVVEPGRESIPLWDAGIREAARNFGAELLSPIGWMVIPSQS